MATKTKFLNYYATKGKKEDFTRKLTKDDRTDQSQIVSASIKEMAKKFGIDAIMSKALEEYANESLQDKLYGYDFTKMCTSKLETLQVKKNIQTLFEKIPAVIRKKEFNDDVTEFVNAYTSEDIDKLTKLNQYGLVSNTQIEAVKAYKENLRKNEEENKIRLNFVNKLETMKEGLYDEFKKTGNINVNFNQDVPPNSQDVQTNI